MRRPLHYSPAIERFLVSALYHEAHGRGMPMTKLANELLEKALLGTEGWRKAEESMQLQETPPQYGMK